MKTIKKAIRINRSDRTIIVSKPFLKRANIFNTEENVILEKVRAAYPDFTIEARTIRKANNEHYKGLTYSYMEHYIRTHENSKERMEEYNEMRLRAECHSMKYGHIKSWFLSAYPQIDDFTPEDFQRECKTTALDLIHEGASDEPIAA